MCSEVCFDLLVLTHQPSVLSRWVYPIHFYRSISNAKYLQFEDSAGEQQSRSRKGGNVLRILSLCHEDYRDTEYFKVSPVSLGFYSFTGYSASVSQSNGKAVLSSPEQSWIPPNPVRKWYEMWLSVSLVMKWGCSPLPMQLHRTNVYIMSLSNFVCIQETVSLDQRKLPKCQAPFGTFAVIFDVNLTLNPILEIQSVSFFLFQLKTLLSIKVMRFLLLQVAAVGGWPAGWQQWCDAP